MFKLACVQGDDGGSQRVQEDEMLSKVLEEGLRLRRKSKSLSKLFADTEDRRKSEQELYESTLKDTDDAFERQLHELNDRYIIDVAAVRDSKTNELNNALVQLKQATVEVNRLQSVMEALQTQSVNSDKRMYVTEDAQAKELRSLQEDVTEAQCRYVELEQTIRLREEQANADRDALEQRCVDGAALLASIESNIDNIEGQIIARKTSQKAAKSEREMRHLKQMQTLEAQLTAMQESLSRTVRENESVAESVNFQNEENKERIAELERCCESVRNELVAMQTQHTKEAQRTASLRVHLRDTEAEARRDMAGLLETIRAQQGQLLNQRHEIEILTEKVGELVSAKSIIEGDVRPIMMENAALRRCISRIEPGRDASNPVPILMQMPNYLTLAIKDRAQCNYSTDYAKDASDGQIEAPKLD